MMREILFRGKRVCNGQWLFGGFHSRFGRAFIIGCSKSFRIDGMDVIPETVGQFTGLTDKNGKRIFEGDIVKIPGSKMMGLPAPIYYNKQGAVFHIRRNGFQPITLWDASESVVVIGNIHDNPELLEG